MLPFLKKRPQVGVITQVRHSDSEKEADAEEAGLKSCAEDLITAVQSGDAKGVAAALKAAFDICESYPHEEGPHIEPHSYEAQKEE